METNYNLRKRPEKPTSTKEIPTRSPRVIRRKKRVKKLPKVKPVIINENATVQERTTLASVISPTSVQSTANSPENQQEGRSSSVLSPKTSNSAVETELNPINSSEIEKVDLNKVLPIDLNAINFNMEEILKRQQPLELKTVIYPVYLQSKQTIISYTYLNNYQSNFDVKNPSNELIQETTTSKFLDMPLIDSPESYSSESWTSSDSSSCFSSPVQTVSNADCQSNFDLNNDDGFASEKPGKESKSCQANLFMSKFKCKCRKNVTKYVRDRRIRDQQLLESIIKDEDLIHLINKGRKPKFRVVEKARTTQDADLLKQRKKALIKINFNNVLMATYPNTEWSVEIASSQHNFPRTDCHNQFSSAKVQILSNVVVKSSILSNADVKKKIQNGDEDEQCGEIDTASANRLNPSGFEPNPTNNVEIYVSKDITDYDGVVDRLDRDCSSVVQLFPLQCDGVAMEKQDGVTRQGNRESFDLIDQKEVKSALYGGKTSNKSSNTSLSNKFAIKTETNIKNCQRVDENQNVFTQVFTQPKNPETCNLKLETSSSKAKTFQSTFEEASNVNLGSTTSSKTIDIYELHEDRVNDFTDNQSGWFPRRENAKNVNLTIENQKFFNSEHENMSSTRSLRPRAEKPGDERIKYQTRSKTSQFKQNEVNTQNGNEEYGDESSENETVTNTSPIVDIFVNNAEREIISEQLLDTLGPDYFPVIHKKPKKRNLFANANNSIKNTIEVFTDDDTDYEDMIDRLGPDYQPIIRRNWRNANRTCEEKSSKQVCSSMTSAQLIDTISPDYFPVIDKKQQTRKLANTNNSINNTIDVFTDDDTDYEDMIDRLGPDYQPIIRRNRRKANRTCEKKSSKQVCSPMTSAQTIDTIGTDYFPVIDKKQQTRKLANANNSINNTIEVFTDDDTDRLGPDYQPIIRCNRRNAKRTCEEISSNKVCSPMTELNLEEKPKPNENGMKMTAAFKDMKEVSVVVERISEDVIEKYTNKSFKFFNKENDIPQFDGDDGSNTSTDDECEQESHPHQVDVEDLSELLEEHVGDLHFADDASSTEFSDVCTRSELQSHSVTSSHLNPIEFSQFPAGTDQVNSDISPKLTKWEEFSARNCKVIVESLAPQVLDYYLDKPSTSCVPPEENEQPNLSSLPIGRTSTCVDVTLGPSSVNISYAGDKSVPDVVISDSSRRATSGMLDLPRTYAQFRDSLDANDTCNGLLSCSLNEGVLQDGDLHVNAENVMILERKVNQEDGEVEMVSKALNKDEIEIGAKRTLKSPPPLKSVAKQTGARSKKKIPETMVSGQQSIRNRKRTSTKEAANIQQKRRNIQTESDIGISKASASSSAKSTSPQPSTSAAIQNGAGASTGSSKKQPTKRRRKARLTAKPKTKKATENNGKVGSIQNVKGRKRTTTKKPENPEQPQNAKKGDVAKNKKRKVWTRPPTVCRYNLRSTTLQIPQLDGTDQQVFPNVSHYTLNNPQHFNIPQIDGANDDCSSSSDDDDECLTRITRSRTKILAKGNVRKIKQGRKGNSPAIVTVPKVQYPPLNITITQSPHSSSAFKRGSSPRTRSPRKSPRTVCYSPRARNSKVVKTSTNVNVDAVTRVLNFDAGPATNQKQIESNSNQLNQSILEDRIVCRYRSDARSSCSENAMPLSQVKQRIIAKTGGSPKSLRSPRSFRSSLIGESESFEGVIELPKLAGNSLGLTRFKLCDFDDQNKAVKEDIVENIDKIEDIPEIDQVESPIFEVPKEVVVEEEVKFKNVKVSKRSPEEAGINAFEDNILKSCEEEIVESSEEEHVESSKEQDNVKVAKISSIKENKRLVIAPEENADVTKKSQNFDRCENEIISTSFKLTQISSKKQDTNRIQGKTSLYLQNQIDGNDSDELFVSPMDLDISKTKRHQQNNSTMSQNQKMEKNELGYHQSKEEITLSSSLEALITPYQENQPPDDPMISYNSQENIFEEFLPPEESKHRPGYNPESKLTKAEEYDRTNRVLPIAGPSSHPSSFESAILLSNDENMGIPKAHNLSVLDLTTHLETISEDAHNESINKMETITICSSAIPPSHHTKTDKYRYITPKYKPPSLKLITNTLSTYNIPSHRNLDPFYSDPKHVTGAIDIGHNTLRILSRHQYPEFVNSFKSLGEYQKEISGVQNKKELTRLKLSYCTSNSIFVTPVKKPPSVKEVKLWLLKRKHQLKKKKKDKSSLEDHDLPEETCKEVQDNDHDATLLGLTIQEGMPGIATSPRLNKSAWDNSHAISGVSLNNTHGFKMTLENLQEARSLDIYQYITSLVVEIHAECRGDKLPDPQLDPVKIIFFALANDIPEKKSSGSFMDTTILQTGSGGEEQQQEHFLKGFICVNNESGNILEGTGIALSKYVHVVSDESSLFQKFLELFHTWNPDILMGYEIENSSWGYLVERGYILGLNLPSLLSRIKETEKKHTHITPEDRDKDHQEELHSHLKITGRIVIDLWRILKHEIALQSYTFENLAYHVLHERVPHYSTRDLALWWNHKSAKYRHRTIDYYLYRAEGAFRLIDHYDLIGRTSELARLFGILFYEVLSRGSQFRVESMMLRLAKPYNFVPVSPNVQQRAHMKAPEFLPLILEPESKFYKDPVIVLDFQSLYPSIMIAYNYCFSTCLGRVEHLGSHADTKFEFGAYELEVSKKLIGRLLKNNQLTISPCGVAFVKSEVRPGIMPRMLREILDTRLMVKKSMKKHKGNKTLQKVLHSRQLGLKLIANVTYGYTAANFSGRMPACELADSVVSKGRETLQRAINLVETHPTWGARVVYGDTDSMFVLCEGKSREEAFAIGDEIAEAVTNANPSPVRLKLEKVYQPCILQTKKRYVGYMYESKDQKVPEFEAKGIETVRRDGCPAASKMLEKCLKLLFDNRDVSQVRNYVLKQFNKILTGRVSIQDLTFAKEYRGKEGYRPGACVPALELTRKWMSSDKRKEPRSGERVPYVIINGPPGLPLIKLVKSPHDLLVDSSLRPNALYYITKAIIPPINRCFKLIGADLFNWFNEMPRKQVQYLHTGSPSKGPKSTISQYFATAACASCGQQTKDGVCVKCVNNPQTTIVNLHRKISLWERHFYTCRKICESCCERTTDLACNSLDCPVLYRLKQTSHDLQQAEFVRSLMSDCFPVDDNGLPELF